MGFALIFYGLNLMTGGLRPLRGMPEVMSVISSLKADNFLHIIRRGQLHRLQVCELMYWIGGQFKWLVHAAYSFSGCVQTGYRPVSRKL
jgi:Na+/phosphate symporter